MKANILIYVLILILFTISINVSAGTVSPIVRQSSSVFHAATITHSFNLIMDGVVPGDLLVICIEFNAPPGTIVFPSGWNQSTITVFTSFVAGVCIYRFFMFGDTSPIIVTTTNSIQDAAVQYQITGASTIYRDFIGASDNTGTNTNINPPSISISPSDQVLVIAVYLFGNNNFCHITAYPAGFGNNIIASADDGGNSARAAMSTKSELIGNDDPAVATLSIGCRWVSFTFAVGGNVIVGLVLSNETILLLLITSALVIIGFKIPLFWLLGALTGFFSAFFIFRDINSVPASALVIIISLIILFMFMVKALGDKIGLGD